VTDFNQKKTEFASVARALNDLEDDDGEAFQAAFVKRKRKL
jgi:hypothetical protein